MYLFLPSRAALGDGNVGEFLPHPHSCNQPFLFTLSLGGAIKIRLPVLSIMIDLCQENILLALSIEKKLL